MCNAHYPFLKGSYTEEEVAKYTKLAKFISPTLLFVSIIFMFVFWMVFVVVIAKLHTVTWYLFESNSICFTQPVKFFDFLDCLNGFLLGFTIAMPSAPLFLLKLLYPKNHKPILDFVSAKDKIDFSKWSRTMLKTGPLVALSLYCYGDLSGVQVMADRVRFKDCSTLAKTVYFKDVAQLVDYKYAPRHQNAGDTFFTDVYTLKMKKGDEIRLCDEYLSDSCARLLESKIGKPRNYIPSKW